MTKANGVVSNTAIQLRLHRCHIKPNPKIVLFIFVLLFSYIFYTYQHRLVFSNWYFNLLIFYWVCQERSIFLSYFLLLFQKFLWPLSSFLDYRRYSPTGFIHERTLSATSCKPISMSNYHSHAFFFFLSWYPLITSNTPPFWSSAEAVHRNNASDRQRFILVTIASFCPPRQGTRIRIFFIFQPGPFSSSRLAFFALPLFTQHVNRC